MRLRPALSRFCLVSFATCLAVAAGTADAAPTRTAGTSVKILGFTSAPWLAGVAPQAKAGGKITTCLDSGSQRQVAVIIRVAGFPKSARIGVALYGGNSGFQGAYQPEPTLASVVKGARPWAQAATAAGAATGISFGSSGTPANIDGVWNAYVVVDGKKRASGHVTVACSG